MTAPIAAFPFASPVAGVIWPLYITPSPGTGYPTIVDLHNAYPRVPFVVILDPLNGPGTSYSADYAYALNQLQSNGIICIGYVHSTWGARPIADIKADMAQWMAWYPTLQGFFCDEMSTNDTYLADYQALNKYGKSICKPPFFTVGNTGDFLTPVSYYNGNSFDVIVIYEEAGKPAEYTLQTSFRSYRNSIAMMGRNVPTLNRSYIHDIKQWIKWIWLSDYDANAYSTVPSYMLSLLDALNSGGQTIQMGSATLVAGSVTVAADVLSDSVVLNITRSATGGTLGHLKTANYVVGRPGSFDIVSSSATETSTVNWALINTNNG